jgi:PGF-CTERM protein
MDDGEDDGMDDGTDDGMSDGTDDGMSDGTDSATNESEDEDGSGPGFGPIAGVAGLGGAAAYLYRRAGGVSDPATDEDES